MTFQRLTSERRRRARGTSAAPQRTDLIGRVLGSFQEMPGLKLTLDQATRLMGVDSDACTSVLDELVRRGELRRLASGSYGLPDAI
jgi:hypothetical protein